VVELLSLVPSLFLVQFFRRIRQRHSTQDKLAAIYATIQQFKQPTTHNIRSNVPKRWSGTFPWWCIFIAYGFSLMVVGVSILFVIARGIEFGDSKTQKWLLSLIIGFFSSVLLTQPIKVTHRLV
jgi:hypothetical protein